MVDRSSSKFVLQRKKFRRILAKGEPPCSVCGKPIDYSLPYPDPGSFVVDHVIPIAKGGGHTLDNARPAHNACNRAKWHRLDGGTVVRRSGSIARPE